jgi:hypothetical protein
MARLPRGLASAFVEFLIPGSCQDVVTVKEPKSDIAKQDCTGDSFAEPVVLPAAPSPPAMVSIRRPMCGPSFERDTKLAPIKSLVSQSLTSARLVLGAKLDALVDPDC